METLSAVERKAEARSTHNPSPRSVVVLIWCALSFSGCVRLTTERTFSGCIASGESALVRGQLNDASTIAASCGKMARTFDEQWQDRILRAEVLIAQRRFLPCIELLAVEPAPPPSSKLGVRRAIALGLSKLRTNESTEAEQLLTVALATARQSKWLDLEAQALVCMALPRLKPAERRALLRQAMERARQAHDPALEAEVAGAFGFFEMDLQPLVAIPWFEESVKMAQRAGALGWQQKSIGNAGVAHFRVGNYDLAIEHAEQAAALAEQIGSYDDQVVWLNLRGNIENVQARPEAAKPFYLQALAVARQRGTGLATTLNNLSNVAVQERNFAEARKYHDEADAERQRVKGPPVIDFPLGYLLSGEKKTDEAVAVFRDILENPKASVADKRQARLSIMGAYFGVNRDKEATAEADILLDDLRNERTQSRQLSLTLLQQSVTARFYRAYISRLLERGRRDEALVLAEEARSGKQLTAEDMMQAAASRNAVILNYWPGERTSSLWIITARNIAYKELPKEGALRDTLREHERQLSGSRHTEPVYLTAGQKLYQELLGHNLDSKRVIVIADGDLGRLNWETLVTGSQPHYWIEDAIISRAFSIASLNGTRQPPASDRLLVYGNPNLPAAKYPVLQRAETEIRMVTANYGNGRTQVVERDKANAASFSDAHPDQFGYIHFVTHGEANLRAPLESALLFSGQPESRLTANAVARMPVRARLVTLSACHSAGLKTYRGAGLVGMSWAFLHAGAQYAIAGLWEINDAASASLHPMLYRMIAEGTNPAEALHQAKLRLLKSDANFRKPYYWGAWVLFEGNP